MSSPEKQLEETGEKVAAAQAVLGSAESAQMPILEQRGEAMPDVGVGEPPPAFPSSVGDAPPEFPPMGKQSLSKMALLDMEKATRKPRKAPGDVATARKAKKPSETTAMPATADLAALVQEFGHLPQYSDEWAKRIAEPVEKRIKSSPSRPDLIPIIMEEAEAFNAGHVAAFIRLKDLFGKVSKRVPNLKKDVFLHTIMDSQMKGKMRLHPYTGSRASMKDHDLTIISGKEYMQYLEVVPQQQPEAVAKVAKPTAMPAQPVAPKVAKQVAQPADVLPSTIAGELSAGMDQTTGKSSVVSQEPKWKVGILERIMQTVGGWFGMGQKKAEGGEVAKADLHIAARKGDHQPGPAPGEREDVQALKLAKGGNADKQDVVVMPDEKIIDAKTAEENLTDLKKINEGNADAATKSLDEIPGVMVPKEAGIPGHDSVPLKAEEGSFVVKASMTEGEGDESPHLTAGGEVELPGAQRMADGDVVEENSPMPTDEQLQNANYETLNHLGNSNEVAKVTVGKKSYLFKSGSGNEANELIAQKLASAANVFAPKIREASVAGKHGLLSEWVEGEKVSDVAGLSDRELGKLMGISGSAKKITAAQSKKFQELEKKLRPGEVDRHILFSFLAGINDRHLGNYLVKGNQLTSIDNEFMDVNKGSRNLDDLTDNLLFRRRKGDNDNTNVKLDSAAIADMAEKSEAIAKVFREEGRHEQAEQTVERGHLLKKLAGVPNPTFADLQSIAAQDDSSAHMASGGEVPPEGVPDAENIQGKFDGSGPQSFGTPWQASREIAPSRHDGGPQRVAGVRGDGEPASTDAVGVAGESEGGLAGGGEVTSMDAETIHGESGRGGSLAGATEADSPVSMAHGGEIRTPSSRMPPAHSGVPSAELPEMADGGQIADLHIEARKGDHQSGPAPGESKPAQELKLAGGGPVDPPFHTVSPDIDVESEDGGLWPVKFDFSDPEHPYAMGDVGQKPLEWKEDTSLGYSIYEAENSDLQIIPDKNNYKNYTLYHSPASLQMGVPIESQYGFPIAHSENVDELKEIAESYVPVKIQGDLHGPKQYGEYNQFNPAPKHLNASSPVLDTIDTSDDPDLMSNSGQIVVSSDWIGKNLTKHGASEKGKHWTPQEASEQAHFLQRKKWEAKYYGVPGASEDEPFGDIPDVNYFSGGGEVPQAEAAPVDDEEVLEATLAEDDIPRLQGTPTIPPINVEDPARTQPVVQEPSVAKEVAKLSNQAGVDLGQLTSEINVKDMRGDSGVFYPSTEKIDLNQGIKTEPELDTTLSHELGHAADFHLGSETSPHSVDDATANKQMRKLAKEVKETGHEGTDDYLTHPKEVMAELMAESIGGHGTRFKDKESPKLKEGVQWAKDEIFPKLPQLAEGGEVETIPSGETIADAPRRVTTEEIRSLMKSAKIKSPYGTHPDHTSSKLTREKDFDELAEQLIPMIGKSGVKHLGSGAFNSVLDIGNDLVARIGHEDADVPENDPDPRVDKSNYIARPDTDEILQPLTTLRTGKGLRAEIMPRVSTEGVSKEMVVELAKSLSAKGYIWEDPALGNIGIHKNGKPVVTDPGFMRRRLPDEPDPDFYATGGDIKVLSHVRNHKDGVRQANEMAFGGEVEETSMPDSPRMADGGSLPTTDVPPHQQVISPEERAVTPTEFRPVPLGDLAMDAADAESTFKGGVTPLSAPDTPMPGEGASWFGDVDIPMPGQYGDVPMAEVLPDLPTPGEKFTPKGYQDRFQDVLSRVQPQGAPKLRPHHEAAQEMRANQEQVEQDEQQSLGLLGRMAKRLGFEDGGDVPEDTDDELAGFSNDAMDEAAAISDFDAISGTSVSDQPTAMPMLDAEALAGVGMATGGEVEEDIPVAQHIAPTFYSRLQKAIEGLGSKPIPAEAVKNRLAKSSKEGFSDEEWQWSGMDSAIEGKKSVTRDELLKHFAENQVQVQDATKEWHPGDVWDEENGPKYIEKQTPGGKNYREMFLTTPDRHTPEEKEVAQAKLSALENTSNPSHAEMQRLQKEAAGKDNFTIFQGSHWDEPNVLAHVRMNDRTGPNGEKILHVEEIQSDWHQKGQKRGYESEVDLSQWDVVKDENSDKWAVVDLKRGTRYPISKMQAQDKQAAIKIVIDKNTVPDAPFKEDWPTLAMKRVVRHAAENGYDRITLNSGEQINTILGGNPESLGGQKQFYDKTLPNVMSKLGKPFGAKVEPYTYSDEDLSGTGDAVEADSSLTVTSLPITPELRRSAMTKGFPLMEQGGEVHMADGGDTPHLADDVPVVLEPGEEAKLPGDGPTLEVPKLMGKPESGDVVPTTLPPGTHVKPKAQVASERKLAQSMQMPMMDMANVPHMAFGGWLGGKKSDKDMDAIVKMIHAGAGIAEIRAEMRSRGMPSGGVGSIKKLIERHGKQLTPEKENLTEIKKGHDKYLQERIEARKADLEAEAKSKQAVPASTDFSLDPANFADQDFAAQPVASEPAQSVPVPTAQQPFTFSLPPATAQTMIQPAKASPTQISPSVQPTMLQPAQAVSPPARPAAVAAPSATPTPAPSPAAPTSPQGTAPATPPPTPIPAAPAAPQVQAPAPSAPTAPGSPPGTQPTATMPASGSVPASQQDDEEPGFMDHAVQAVSYLGNSALQFSQEFFGAMLGLNFKGKKKRKEKEESQQQKQKPQKPQKPKLSPKDLADAIADYTAILNDPKSKPNTRLKARNRIDQLKTRGYAAGGTVEMPDNVSHLESGGEVGTMPGSVPDTDSVLAELSPKEVVVPAPQAEANKDELQDIIGGVPQMADGGTVPGKYDSATQHQNGEYRNGKSHSGSQAWMLPDAASGHFGGVQGMMGEARFPEQDDFASVTASERDGGSEMTKLIEQLRKNTEAIQDLVSTIEQQNKDKHQSGMTSPGRPDAKSPAFGEGRQMKSGAIQDGESLIQRMLSRAVSAAGGG